MIRVLLDTNVILSAILFGGKPRQILDLISAFQIQGFLSRHILAEVSGVLRKKFKLSQEKIDQIESLLVESFQVIEPDFSVNLIKGKLADNRILECALAAKADYLISGDTKHILPLKKIKGTKIVSPDEFLKQAFE